MTSLFQIIPLFESFQSIGLGAKITRAILQSFANLENGDVGLLLETQMSARIYFQNNALNQLFRLAIENFTKVATSLCSEIFVLDLKAYDSDITQKQVIYLVDTMTHVTRSHIHLFQFSPFYVAV
jgi:hypothetical protein